MTDYVHYGCGLCAPEGWRNFDVSPTLRLRRLPLIGEGIIRLGRLPSWPKSVEYGDIVRGLPVAEGSCRAIYCSHVLEHLALGDLRRALANTYRYLAPGGRFRLVVPDLKQLATEYISSSDPEAALRFMEASYLGTAERRRGLSGLLRGWLGNSTHLWMWDFDALRLELEQVGFREIRRAQIGDSAEPRFREVEEVGRWADCLGIECRR